MVTVPDEPRGEAKDATEPENPAASVIADVAAGINEGNTAVFCGAGISLASGFPIVYQLVPYVLAHLCSLRRKSISESIQNVPQLVEKIARKTGVPVSSIEKLLTELPFEAFIQTLGDNSNIDDFLALFDANSYDPPVMPNTNHRWLAKLVRAGKLKTIYTTNFDQLIENALLIEGLEPKRDYDLAYSDDAFKAIDWTQDRVRLIKLHGSVHNKRSMAITLRQVAARRLTVARASLIRQMFSQYRHARVLILGYSCSDVFDLSPQIASLTEGQKVVCLCQHASNIRVEGIQEKSNKNPFKGYPLGARLFINTTELVRELWPLTLKDPYQPAVGRINWKERVNRWSRESEVSATRAFKSMSLGMLFNAIAEWPAALSHYRNVLEAPEHRATFPLRAAALNNSSAAYAHLGNYKDALTFARRSLRLSRSVKDRRGEAHALSNLAIANKNLGRVRQAIAQFQQQLAISVELRDSRSQSVALANTGNLYSAMGDYPEALSCYRKAQAIAIGAGDVKVAGDLAANTATTYANLGNFRKAARLYEKAIDLAKKVADVSGESVRLSNLANVEADLGEWQDAAGTYERAAEMAERIGDLRGQGVALANLGRLREDQGLLEEARAVYVRSYDIALAMRDLQGSVTATNNLASLYIRLDRPDDAMKMAKLARRTARQLGDSRGEESALNNMGSVRYLKRAFPDANKWFARALTIARSIGDLQGEGDTLNNIGLTRLAQRQFPVALASFEEAARIAARIEDPVSEANATANIGLVRARLGQINRAMRSFRESRRIFQRIGLTQMVDNVDQMIATARTGGPETPAQRYGSLTGCED